jgi:hypothetical protein
MRWSACLFRGFAKGRGAVHELSIRFDAEAVQVSICQVVAVGKCQAQSAAGARHRSDHRPSPGLRPLAVSHHRPGRPAAFCDFAGPGDESVLALCDGNRAQIVDAWCSRETMHSVGKFLSLFRKLNLQSYQVDGDEGYGHQLMDRMQEEGFYLQGFNNGSPAKHSEIYTNLSAEWWSIVGQLIEWRQIIIPNDEKLIAQLTSRRKLYDSKGREKLESKADLAARGVESPDRADALIGAIVLGQAAKAGWKEVVAISREIKRQMRLDYLHTGRGRRHIEW